MTGRLIQFYISQDGFLFSRYSVYLWMDMLHSLCVTTDLSVLGDLTILLSILSREGLLFHLAPYSFLFSL